MGFGTVKLDWAIQAASMGDGRSHMVMQAGRYGGLTALTPADFTDRIREAALPLEGKKVHVQSLPEKKEKNVRQFVLPPEARDAKIVVVFDETSFGSAKDAVVFTSTHLYAHELGTRVS